MNSLRVAIVFNVHLAHVAILTSALQHSCSGGVEDHSHDFRNTQRWHSSAGSLPLDEHGKIAAIQPEAA